MWIYIARLIYINQIRISKKLPKSRVFKKVERSRDDLKVILISCMTWQNCYIDLRGGSMYLPGKNIILSLLVRTN